MATVKRTFCHDMISGEFYDHATHGRTMATRKMAAELSKALDRTDDTFMSAYAEAMQYTVALTFHWLPDVPDHYTAFEKWWKMVLKGEEQAKCYSHLSENVDWNLILEWRDAYLSAMQQWKPPEQRMTEDGQTDSPKE